jgi:hypothetical protein
MGTKHYENLGGGTKGAGRGGARHYRTMIQHSSNGSYDICELWSKLATFRTIILRYVVGPIFRQQPRTLEFTNRTVTRSTGPDRTLAQAGRSAATQLQEIKLTTWTSPESAWAGHLRINVHSSSWSKDFVRNVVLAITTGVTVTLGRTRSARGNRYGCAVVFIYSPSYSVTIWPWCLVHFVLTKRFSRRDLPVRHFSQRCKPAYDSFNWPASFQSLN